MLYHVILSNGNKSTAVDIDQLNAWILEGVLNDTMMIERASDGVQGPATMLPGLKFPPKTSLGAFNPNLQPVPGTQPQPSAPAQASAPKAPAGEAGKAPVFKEADFVPPKKQEHSIDELGRPMSYVSYTREHLDRRVLPPELNGFSWGAFFMTWLWGLFNRAWLAVPAVVFMIGMIPFESIKDRTFVFSSLNIGATCIYVGYAVFAGIMGNRWAWQGGRFSTPENCRSCQSAWGQWGGGIFAIVFFLAGLAGIFMIPAVREALNFK